MPIAEAEVPGGGTKVGSEQFAPKPLEGAA
jgi:hypothetical protein